MRIGLAYRAVALATALAGAGAFAAAQIPEEEGGLRTVLGIDLRLESNNGDPEFRTGFDLILSSANRTQRLRFTGDFGVTVPLDDPGQADVIDPGYGLDYVRDTGRSRVDFSAAFSRRDIDNRFVLIEAETPFEEDELVLLLGGTLEQRRAEAGLAVGLADPVGAEIRYRFEDRAYSGATDPRLEDRRSEEVTASLRMDVDPTLRLTLDTSLRETEETGVIPETTERTRIGFGATWQVRPDVSLSGSIARSRIDREQLILGLPVRTDRDGVDVTLGATLDRPGAVYRLDFSRILNDTGFTRTVEVGATYELPREARLSASVGATELPSGETYTIASLDYARETRIGALSWSLSRTATVNADDAEVERTILQGSYSLDLPAEARIGLSARLTDSDFTLPATPDIASARLSVSYSRPVTEDWDFSTGVSWQRTRQDGAAARTDERVFLGLERRFVFRR